MKGNPNSNSMRDKCDQRWGRIICSGGKCEMCRKTYCIAPHHLIKRRVRLYRHDLRNGICLCLFCHTGGLDLDIDVVEDESAHGAPKKFLANLREKYPEKWQFIEDHKHDRRPNFFKTYKDIFHQLGERLT